MDFPPRAPLIFRIQSKSPVLGCLMLIVGVVVAVVLGLMGLLALVWRLIWSPFARPPSVAESEPDHRPPPPQMDAIDVESEVVTDESRTLEDKE